jgi:diacylglycerol kinase (ATP)
MDRQKPKRKQGVAHFFAPAGYSAAGLRRLWRESAFKQEVPAGGIVVLGLWVWGATGPQLPGAAGLVLLIVLVEALNTAPEAVVDHLSPGWSVFAKDTRDLGSLAVAAATLILGFYVIGVLVRGLHAGPNLDTTPARAHIRVE